MSNIVIMFCIILFLLLILNLSMWSICRQNYLNAKKLMNIQDGIATSNSATNDIYHLIIEYLEMENKNELSNK